MVGGSLFGDTVTLGLAERQAGECQQCDGEEREILEDRSDGTVHVGLLGQFQVKSEGPKGLPRRGHLRLSDLEEDSRELRPVAMAPWCYARSFIGVGVR